MFLGSEILGMVILIVDIVILIRRLIFIRMKIFYLLSALVVSVICSFAHAQNDAFGALDDQLKRYESLSGQFQQTLVDHQGLLIQESSGEFMLKRPGYFRWDTRDPFPQLLISNLKTIWLYDPDLEQVTVRSYQNMLDQTPSLLLGGKADAIAEKYQVVFSEQSSEQSLHFILTPKFDDSTFTQLQLIFHEGLLAVMILRDSLDQTTTFRFSELTRDPPIDSDVFEFTPPEGVDVLVDE
ncbi:MAG: outer membrane lipoprotein carrier protein [Cellvibrionaceae bacterium]